MLSRIFFLFSCFLLSVSLVQAEEFSLTHKKSIVLDNGYFTTDPIGNIYVVRDNNFIIKYNDIEIDKVYSLKIFIEIDHLLFLIKCFID